MENSILEAKNSEIKLNEQQLEAVNHVDGPLLILAGAGSGKTGTMTSRIAHMIKDCGISEYSILAVTFTNKAAGEMRSRVEKILGRQTRVWILTFHAACLRILRAYPDVLGYKPGFTVYDPVDCKAIAKRIVKTMQLNEKQFPVGMLLGKISKCKEEELTPALYKAQATGSFMEEKIAEVYEEYQAQLRKNNAMDFDDLLLNTLLLFEKDKSVLEKYRQRFTHVMVDEYQDTNRVQYKFVRALTEKSTNLCVVGDDDQCIYQWRGADIRNILDFESDFPGAKVIKLEKNYRSTANILNAAHSVISNNLNRKKKKLWTDGEEGAKVRYQRLRNEKEEAWYVAQEIDRLKTSDRRYKDFAVLYRTNAQSRNFEEALSRRDIPYRVVGSVRYYDRQEIKDIVAYMRLVENPSDDLALDRVINVPRRGIGKTTKEKLQTLARVRKQSLFEVICDEEVVSSLSQKSREGLKNLTDTLREYHEEKENLRVSDIYDGLLNTTGYIQALEDSNKIENQARIENLLEFKSVVIGYEEEAGKVIDEEEKLTLSGFLEKIAILSDIDNQSEDEDAVTLMTLHSAKGLEFPFVFMPGMEDGLFPGWRKFDSESELEEERRLCYVGITRAKQRLCMTGAEYRVMYGQGEYTRESTFLREIDPKLIDGDGIYTKKEEVRHGNRIALDGYANPAPRKPFDRLNAAKRELKEKKKNTETFATGDKVSHAKFGEGTVIEVDGRKVSIMFDSAGLKKLASDVAPLKKI